MKLITVKAFLLGLLIFAGTATAQRNGGRWTMLGTAHVDGGVDHDNIRVGGSQPYRAVQLRVRGSAINFQRVIVHFENGQDQELQFRNTIRAGGSTRPLDLVGNRRNLRSVEFFYARGGWGRIRPSVALYGMR